MKISAVSKCRVCGNDKLTRVIDLGKQYLQGSFIKPGKEMPPIDRIECSILWCNQELNYNGCGLLQMEHTVPPEILYDAYWYRSGTNQTMRDHLKEIAESASSILKRESLKVLDIGCNDGTLLSNYPESYEKYGCDPSDVAQEVSIAKVVQDVFPSKSLDTLLNGIKLDMITSIAMFYDLSDPVGFVKNIKKNLAKNGVWIFEMSYMPTMIELDSYDTICHEHLEYYSLKVLNTICEMGGVKIFKISFNDINGGSIRCYTTHKENSVFDSEENMKLMYDTIAKEDANEYHTVKPYIDFQQRINVLKKDLNDLLTNLKNEGKRIHIYGASTKGNTILQWCNIDKNLIDYAAERNPDKYGAMTLGTGIPIISEAESRAMNPDYYLVLPWHFKEEFLEREKNAIENGTGFIFPVPKIEIYKK
jgi:SAM-dependent methyltransferase